MIVLEGRNGGIKSGFYKRSKRLDSQIMVSRSWIFNDLSIVISNALIQDVKSKKP